MSARSGSGASFGKGRRKRCTIITDVRLIALTTWSACNTVRDGKKMAARFHQLTGFPQRSARKGGDVLLKFMEYCGKIPLPHFGPTH
jgi:hypothetical protein